jgi:hypothetical protein
VTYLDTARAVAKFSEKFQHLDYLSGDTKSKATKFEICSWNKDQNYSKNYL